MGSFAFLPCFSAVLLLSPFFAPLLIAFRVLMVAFGFLACFRGLSSLATPPLCMPFSLFCRLPVTLFFCSLFLPSFVAGFRGFSPARSSARPCMRFCRTLPFLRLVFAWINASWLQLRLASWCVYPAAAFFGFPLVVAIRWRFPRRL